MTVTSSTVSDLLNDVLDAVAAGLAGAGRPVDRVCKFPGGEPSWDCEMLAAWPRMRLGDLGTVDPAGPVRAGTYRHVLDVKLILLRCVTALAHDGTLPAAAVVDADGEGYATDMAVMNLTILGGVADGSLFGSCQAVRPQPTEPRVPSGGLSGMTKTIEVTLG